MLARLVDFNWKVCVDVDWPISRQPDADPPHKRCVATPTPPPPPSSSYRSPSPDRRDVEIKENWRKKKRRRSFFQRQKGLVQSTSFFFLNFLPSFPRGVSRIPFDENLIE